MHLRLITIFGRIGVFAVMMFSLHAKATYVYQDSRYIYQSTPYTQKLSDDDQLQFVMETSFRVVLNQVETMLSQNLIPKEILTIDHLKQLEETNQEIDKKISIVNRWIHMAKLRKGGLRKWDRVPDAFYFFFGAKVSAGAGGSIGLGPTLGVIVMPTHVKQINKSTGEISEYVSFNTETIILVSGNYGVGLGGGSRLRFGIGLIWGGNHFVDPSQFVGAGGGVSGSAVLPFIGGVNAKVGVLMSLDGSMPNTVDFYYTTIAWERGFAAAAEAHMGGTFVYSLEQFLQKVGLVGLEQRESYLNNSMQKEIEKFYSQVHGVPVTPDSMTEDMFRKSGGPKNPRGISKDKDAENDANSTNSADNK